MFFFCRENDCDTLSDLMETTKSLQCKFELCMECKNDVQQDFQCQKCTPIAMLIPKLNLVGSVPEGTRVGGLQETDIMMDLQGLNSSFFVKVTSATRLYLSARGKPFFGKDQNKYKGRAILSHPCQVFAGLRLTVQIQGIFHFLFVCYSQIN